MAPVHTMRTSLDGYLAGAVARAAPDEHVHAGGVVHVRHRVT